MWVIQREARVRICERWISAAGGLCEDFSQRVKERQRVIQEQLNNKKKATSSLESTIVEVEDKIRNLRQDVVRREADWKRKKASEQTRLANFLEFVSEVDERSQRLCSRKEMLEAEWVSARKAREAYKREYQQQKSVLDNRLRRKLQRALEQVAQTKQQEFRDLERTYGSEAAFSMMEEQLKELEQVERRETLSRISSFQEVVHRLESARQSHSKADEMVSKLEEEFDRVMEEVREYQGVHSAEWRTQLSDSQQEASKLVDGISKIDLEMETTTQRVEELLRDSQEDVERISHKDQEVSLLEERLRRLRTDEEPARSRVEELKAECGRAQQKLNEARSALNTMQFSVSKSLRSLEADYLGVVERLKESRKKLRQRLGDCKRLEDELERLQLERSDAEQQGAQEKSRQLKAAGSRSLSKYRKMKEEYSILWGELREEVQDEDDLPPRFEGSDLEDDPLLMSMLQGQEISETLLYDGARLSKNSPGSGKAVSSSSGRTSVTRKRPIHGQIPRHGSTQRAPSVERRSRVATPSRLSARSSFGSRTPVSGSGERLSGLRRPSQQSVDSDLGLNATTSSMSPRFSSQTHSPASIGGQKAASSSFSLASGGSLLPNEGLRVFGPQSELLEGSALEETQGLLLFMLRGGSVYKPTGSARVTSQVLGSHLPVQPRNMFLSSDLTRVEVRAPGKKITESFVKVEHILRVRHKKTPPELRPLRHADDDASHAPEIFVLSIVSKEKPMDLVVTDEDEFALWMSGLKLLADNKKYLFYLRYNLKQLLGAALKELRHHR